jgi:proline racemase
MPVFTLARVIGQKPRREWLIYAHAPMGDKKGIEITIPDFGPVTADISLGGSFCLVKEAEKSVTAVGR